MERRHTKLGASTNYDFEPGERSVNENPYLSRNYVDKRRQRTETIIAFSHISRRGAQPDTKIAFREKHRATVLRFEALCQGRSVIRPPRETGVVALVVPKPRKRLAMEQFLLIGFATGKNWHNRYYSAYKIRARTVRFHADH